MSMIYEAESIQLNWLIYASGNLIIFRPVCEDKFQAPILYSGHANETCVARCSPDGSLVASADVSGCLHIWKNPLAGPKDLYGKIPDIDLLGEWKRNLGVFPIIDIVWASPKLLYIAGGGGGCPTIRALQLSDRVSDGRLVYCETLVGPAKAIGTLTLSPRQEKPLVFAGSDDGALYYGMEELLPFKGKIHGGFIVQTLASSIDGRFLATGGSDGKICIIDCSTWDRLRLESTITAHNSSVLGLAWAEERTDNRKNLLASVSADGTASIWSWEMENDNWLLKSLFNLSIPAVHQETQLVGVCWEKSHESSSLISVLTLSGAIICFRLRQGVVTETFEILGHTNSITCISSFDDRISSQIISCSFDGTFIKSSAHGQFQLLGYVGEPASGIFRFRGQDYGFSSTFGKIFMLNNGLSYGISENLTSIVSVLPFYDQLAIVQSSKLTIINDFSNLKNFTYDFIMSCPSDNEIMCSVVNNHGKILILGRKKDILVVTRINGQYKIETLIATSSPVTALAVTSNCNYLAYAEEQQKRIRVLSRECSTRPEWKMIEKLKWCHHTSRVCGLVWLEDTEVTKSLHMPLLASAGSIDLELAVWSIEGSSLKPIARKSGVHHGMITGLTTFHHSSSMKKVFVTAGQDGLVKYWHLNMQ